MTSTISSFVPTTKDRPFVIEHSDEDQEDDIVILKELTLVEPTIAMHASFIRKQILDLATVTLNRFCLDQKVDIIDLIKMVMENKCGKTNCLAFIGPSNTGKTLLMSLLSNGLSLGIFHHMNYRSSFWLSDLPGKDIYVSEEFICNAETKDYFKALLEGSCFLKADMKYKQALVIPKRPILLSSNYQLWHYCSAEQESFINRCMIFNLEKEINNVHASLFKSFGEIKKYMFGI